MNYDKASKVELVELIGAQDNKIATLLQQLEAQGIELIALKDNPVSQASAIEAATDQDELITSLTNENGTLLAHNNSLISENERLETENTKLTNLVDDLYNQKGELQDNLESAEAIIEDLKEQVFKVERQVEAITGNVVVSYKGKNYVAVIPRFKHNGISYTAEHLKSDHALVAELIENKLGVLRPAAN